MSSTYRLMVEAAEKLAKWRGVYASWKLGTQPQDAPGVRYTRDLHEKLLLLRAEVSALTHLVVEAGITEERLHEVMLREYTELDRIHEQKFPGFRSLPNGIAIDPRVARDTMRRLGFPE